MAKWCNDSALDAALDWIDQADKMVVCSAQPATYAEATSTYALADVAMTPNTDFAKANGDSSGRKITVAAKSDVPVDASGTATHIALVITGTSTLAYVTTCTSQAVVSGTTVNVPAWDIEIGDPV
jgi:hypothetical protein